MPSRHSLLREIKALTAPTAPVRRKGRKARPATLGCRVVQPSLESLEDRAAPTTSPWLLTFDSGAGQLSVVGDEADNSVTQRITFGGFAELELDGETASSDPASVSYRPELAGVTRETLRAIRFDGGIGYDTLVLGNQTLGSLRVQADEQLTVAGILTVAGTVSLSADRISVSGKTRASRIELESSGLTSVEVGGILTSPTIDVAAHVFIHAGELHADGDQGGTIDLVAHNVMNAGTITADGVNGSGGRVHVDFTGDYIDTAQALTSASGVGGGAVVINGGASGRLFASGRQHALGGDGLGGAVHLLGNDIELVGSSADVSGGAGGGTLFAGGPYQGLDPAIVQADLVSVSGAASLRANALNHGNGGVIVVWSRERTSFTGNLSARGGPAGGNGGMLEVSSHGEIEYSGVADAAADLGDAGRLLLDPKNLTIANSGIFPQFNLVDPSHSGSNTFGSQVVLLPNGNIVVADAGDDFAASDAGAVYVYNGLTGALISAIVGSTAGDKVGITFGSVGTVVLTNGNFVIRSPFWNNGVLGSAGAVTWGSGVTGVSGIVSAANSLVGSSTADTVGSNPVIALTNGNYVVTSSLWNNGGLADAGAVTWGNGATGVVGPITPLNSLVGSSANDWVGNFAIALDNGNYLVRHPKWDNGAATDAGAVTWGNGASGVVGVLSAANSLVGSTANDQVGNLAVTVLPNDNYVVVTPLWNDGAVVDAGAVTWGSGASGVAGVIDATNSLVGSTANDQVGNSGVTVLTNGNYVVRSSTWDNGAVTNAGAATWGSGLTGVTGIVSDTNSLVGGSTDDSLAHAGVMALTNGNYVVRTTFWDNGAAIDAGAATWGNGTTGTVGVVSAANSLVGSKTNDRVGLSTNPGSIALSNGNYLIVSQSWDNGAIVNAGAVTWGDGTVGITGIVSASNSLVGDSANDGMGLVTELSNGNYVVSTTSWDNGATTNVGAVTWGNGTTGVTGVVSVSNSLIGSRADDQIGSGGITPLTNGSYVVSSGSWDNGAIQDVGAVTWGPAINGIVGVVSAANSLVGTREGDSIGRVIALTNGNYVVASRNWDNGAAQNAGAATWGSGTSGVTGPITAANSLIGDTYQDTVGTHGVTPLANGNYVVISRNWHTGSAEMGAVTWGNGNGGSVGIVSAANSLVGAVHNDASGNGGVTPLPNGNYVVVSTLWDNGPTTNVGAVTWANGTTGIAGAISAANSVVGSTANDQIGNRGVVSLTNGNYLVCSSLWDNLVPTTSVDAGAITWGNGVTGKTLTNLGPMTAQNSVVGTLTSLVSDPILLDDVNDTFVQLFAGNGGRVTVSFDDPNQMSFARAGSGTLTVIPSFLTQTLSAGAAVTSQASNDITLSNALLVDNSAGSGGPLTFKAGRSILLNANVTTDNADLTLIGNELVANGVIDADRTAGNAAITMASGRSIDLGAGTLTVTLRNSADKTNNARGVATLEAVTAAQTLLTEGTVLVQGTITSAVTVTGGALAGTGIIAGPTTITAGDLSPGPVTGTGILTTGNLALASTATFRVNINGASPGSSHDQVVVNGSVDLNSDAGAGAGLVVALGYVPAPAHVFTILKNATSLSGTFQGLAEGATFASGGLTFKVTYVGGAGHDVVLSIPATATPSVTAVTPFVGPTSGGNVVVVLGANFTSDAQMTVGGANPSSFTVNSASQITAVVAGGSPGTVDVAITTAAGSSNTATAADDYTYAQPTITSVVVNGVSVQTLNGATWSSGNPLITVASTAGLVVGAQASSFGTGFPAGATILSVESGTTFTLNAAPTGTQTTATIISTANAPKKSGTILQLTVATWTNGSTTVSVASTMGLMAGQFVSSAASGLPTDVVVASVTDGTTFVLSSPPTASATGVTIDVANAAIARDQYGGLVDLSGPNAGAIVQHLVVTFNQKVTLDSNAFAIVNLGSSVTTNLVAPATGDVAVVAAAVPGAGNDATGYTQYVLNFVAGSATNSFTNGSTLGNSFTTLKNSLFRLDTVGSKVHAGGDTGTNRSDAFWSLYGVGNPGDVFVTGTPGGGNDQLKVDGLALNDTYATFGSFSNATTPPFNRLFDRDLDGDVDGIDLYHFYANFGTIWSF